MLVEKERQEQEKKAEMQQRAEEALREWTEQRKQDIILNARDNDTETNAEQGGGGDFQREQKGAEQGEKSLGGNIEVKEGNYQESKDVSRMRQAIVSRRNDVKHGIVKFGESG
eukprot:TRINITY_DN4038_c0_g4_i2.p5 TRINITY_DN4038_c0_g4~~TRINITY_DN4038_c0_g4_i2.p5  ORF type:complete len:113 (-),score=42.45 TRINITY_DN4038_c0_g4_i2:151-489(-)